MIYLFILTYVSGAYLFYRFALMDSGIRNTVWSAFLAVVSIVWLPIFLCMVGDFVRRIGWQLLRNLWWIARHDDKKKNLKEAFRIFLTIRTNR